MNVFNWLTLATAGVGPDPNKSFWLPGQMSTTAAENDAVFDFVMLVSVFFCVLIIGLMVYFVFKYRRTDESQPIGEGATHNTPLELTWTAIPLVLVLIMFFWGLNVYVDSTQPPQGSYLVDVTAQQWVWDFRYPSGTSSDDLHAYAGQPFELSMRSSDVLHSLYVPVFRMKKDVVPGKKTTAWFEAIWDEENKVEETLVNGEKQWVNLYNLQCTEYCGTSHWNMNGRVVIHDSVEDFERWQAVAGIRPETMAQAEWGEKLYASKGCKSCHTLDGSQGTGPSWAHTRYLWEERNTEKRLLSTGERVVVDRNYLYTAINQPQAQIVAGPYGNMPYRKFSEDDLESLIAFITTSPSIAAQKPDGN